MASSKNENGVHGFAYLKPPDKTTWEKISTTFYDKSDNTILGRTPFSWGQLLLFYTIFYAVLAALWTICLQGLFSVLDDKTPRWTLDSSLIGTNPGMGFRPISNDTDEGSLIWYNRKNATTSQKWITFMDEFLQEYNVTTRDQVTCDYNKYPAAGEVCKVDLTQFGSCQPANSYGYNSSSPCIFLKLNRIYGWVPEFYNNVNDSDFKAAGLPDDLVTDIEEAINNGSANQIWVSCSGDNGVDQEHLPHKFEYFPSRGFAGYFYPYLNDEGYRSPIVAVQIVQPQPNVLISIECRAWAKNIHYDGSVNEREGSVTFEVMVDEI